MSKIWYIYYTQKLNVQDSFKSEADAYMAAFNTLNAKMEGVEKKEFVNFLSLN